MSGQVHSVCAAYQLRGTCFFLDLFLILSALNIKNIAGCPQLLLVISQQSQGGNYEKFATLVAPYHQAPSDRLEALTAEDDAYVLHHACADVSCSAAHLVCAVSA